MTHPILLTVTEPMQAGIATAGIESTPIFCAIHLEILLLIHLLDSLPARWILLLDYLADSLTRFFC